MSMPFVSSLPFSVTLAYRRMNGVKLRATSRIISVVQSAPLSEIAHLRPWWHTEKEAWSETNCQMLGSTFLF